MLPSSSVDAGPATGLMPLAVGGTLNDIVYHIKCTAARRAAITLLISEREPLVVDSHWARKLSQPTSGVADGQLLANSLTGAASALPAGFKGAIDPISNLVDASLKFRYVGEATRLEACSGACTHDSASCGGRVIGSLTFRTG
jgi:hypothetical protein